MKPTNKLRFVMRSVLHSVQTDGGEIYTFKNILQQWWDNGIGEYQSSYEGEWRDIPVETEE